MIQIEQIWMVNILKILMLDKVLEELQPDVQTTHILEQLRSFRQWSDNLS